MKCQSAPVGHAPKKYSYLALFQSLTPVFAIRADPFFALPVLVSGSS
jgi:hypothetical protein